VDFTAADDDGESASASTSRSPASTAASGVTAQNTANAASFPTSFKVTAEGARTLKE
jgi:hypothetical protein